MGKIFDKFLSNIEAGALLPVFHCAALRVCPIPGQLKINNIDGGHINSQATRLNLSVEASGLFLMVDYFVNFGHQTDGLGESDDDALVVVAVFLGEYTAGAGVLATLGLSILEPFMADLIAANMEVPDLLGHTLEAGGLVLVEPNSFVGIGNLFHSWITGSNQIIRADKLVAGILDLWRFHEVQGNQFSSQLG